MPNAPEAAPDQPGLFLVAEEWRDLPIIEHFPAPEGEPGPFSPVRYSWRGYEGTIAFHLPTPDDDGPVAEQIIENGEAEVSVGTYGHGWVLYEEPLEDVVTRTPESRYTITDETFQALIIRAVTRMRSTLEKQYPDDPDEHDPLTDLDWRELIRAHTVSKQPDVSSFRSLARSVELVARRVEEGQIMSADASQVVLRLAIALYRQHRDN